MVAGAAIPKDWENQLQLNLSEINQLDELDRHLTLFNN